MDATMEIEIITPNKKAIGARVKEARIRAGLEQEDLAKLMDLSQTTVSKFENGKALTLENLTMLSEILDCSLAGLIGIGSQDLSAKEIRLLDLFRALPDHQEAILSILEGMGAKYGNGKS